MNLMTLSVWVPVVGVRKRWPNVLHAVTFDGLPVKTWPRGQATAACGVRNVRVWSLDDEGCLPVPWPPSTRGMPRGYTRCKECWDATGRKRPRSQWRREGE